MEGFILGSSLVYASFAIVFVIGVVLGFIVISLIGGS
jgi:hypothetical protein